MMAAPGPQPGNSERGWNDPPMFNYESVASMQAVPRRNLLNKRVTYPLSPDNMASQKVTPLDPSSGPPMSPVQLLPPASDTSMPTPVPLLIPIMVPSFPPSLPGETTPSNTRERWEDLLKRLHLTEDKDVCHYTVDVFENKLKQCAEQLMERAAEEIKRKIELLKENWSSGKLSEVVKVKVTNLASALKELNFERANQIHLGLMVDHTAEHYPKLFSNQQSQYFDFQNAQYLIYEEHCTWPQIEDVNQWMVGIKRIIQETQASHQIPSEDTSESSKDLLIDTSLSASDGTAIFLPTAKDAVEDDDVQSEPSSETTQNQSTEVDNTGNIL